MLGRIISTLLLVALWCVLEVLLNTGGTIALGSIAGEQFRPNNVSYAGVAGGIALFRGIGTILNLAAIACIAAIWWRPARKAVAALLTCLLLLASPEAHAYYNQSDYTENYFILPNESAFFIPDIGDNKNSQASFGSEEYLSARKIAAKRFEIPHTKLSNSGLWSNYYVPAGRLIIVDRTPVSREWVKQPHRGTDKTDQSFPCQSAEGLDISVGVAIGASVFEESAAKFLFRFGVNPPTGDRNAPEVVFTSVYQGKSLAQVMDGPVRSRVQSLVCDEMTSRTLDQNNKDAAKIMETISKKVADYMTTVGISLDFIGWADTFEFAHEVQGALNRRYVASQDIEVAKAMAPHTATLQALALADGTRKVADKWNGALPSGVSLWWLPSGLGDWIGKALAPNASGK